MQILADVFSEASDNPEFQERLKGSDNQQLFLKTDEFRKEHQEIYDNIQAIAELLRQP